MYRQHVHELLHTWITLRLAAAVAAVVVSLSWSHVESFLLLPEYLAKLPKDLLHQMICAAQTIDSFIDCCHITNDMKSIPQYPVEAGD
jgi:hypothetical protein